MQTDLNAYLQNYANTWLNLGRSAMGGMAGPAAPVMNAASNLGAATAAPQPPQPQQQPQQQPAAPGQSAGGISFESLFRKQPEEVQAQQVADLEKRVGDINKAYDQMVQQLGQRPDTKLSRKEKGMLLMEFGLQLMSQSSGAKHGGDIGGAIGDAGLETINSYRNLKAGKQQAALAHDQMGVNLRAARNKELGQVQQEHRAEVRDNLRLQNEDRRLAASEASAAEAARRGEQQDRRLDLMEREIQARERGVGGYARGGSGSGGGLTANQRNIDDLVKRGVPEELAVRVVYRQIDPRRAFQDLYRDLRRNFNSEDAARREAEDIVGMMFGSDALSEYRDPIAQQGVMKGTSKSGKPIVSRDGGKTWEYED